MKINFRGFNDENTPYSYFLPTSIVKIFNKGLIAFYHPVTLTAQCSADIAKWPFDSHNCTLVFGSPNYYNDDVNYTFPNGYFVSIKRGSSKLTHMHFHPNL